MNTSGANIATVEIKAFAEGDRIPLALREELKRIIEVSFQGREDNDIVSTLTPPVDLTKIWWPINPTTGARQGNPQIWSYSTSEWVDFGTNGVPVFKYRQRRNGRYQLPAGDGTAIVQFDSVETDKYQIRLTPVFFVDGTFAAVPNKTDLGDFFIGVSAMSHNQFSLAYYDAPKTGLACISVDWEVVTIDGTADVLGQI
jgi:hypothetical protein